MKIIRTYTNGKDISYDFPAGGDWTVSFSNSISGIAFVGPNPQANTQNQIKKVNNLGQSVSSLNEYCFYNCTNIDEIILPPQLTDIKTRCFDGCAGLKTLSYGQYEKCDPGQGDPHLNSISAYAFAGCESMRRLTIPASIDGIEKIHENAFADSSISCVIFLGISSDTLLGG